MQRKLKISFNGSLFIIISIFLSILRLFAVEPVVITDSQKETLIGLNLEILKDEKGDLTLEDVLTDQYNDKFQPVKETAPIYGFTNTVYWGRFKVIFNKKTHNPSLLRFNFANLNYVDFYQLNVQGELIKSVKTGNMLPISSRDQLAPKIIFILNGSEEEENIIYFRVKNEASMTLSLSIISVSEFMKETRISEILLGIFMGIMLLIVGYNFFLFYSLKDFSYIFFSISVFSLAGYAFILKGFAYFYLWPDMPYWNQISIPISISFAEFFFLLFISEFLMFKNRLPNINKISPALLVLIFLSMLGAIFIDYLFFIIVINLLVVLIFLLLLVAGIILWYKNYYRSFYFQSSLFVLFIGVMMTILVRFGFIPSNIIIENGIIISSPLFVILMSLALADRVEFYSQAKEIANKALNENEQRLRALVETSNDIIWETNKNREFIYINPRVKDIFGFEPEELVGKDAFSIVKPAYVDKISTVMRESIISHQPIIGLEYIVSGIDGKKVILEKNATPVYDENGKYSGFKGIDRDITERRKYEEALKESEERFRSIVENSPVGIVIGATPFTFKYVNSRFAKMTGYSEGELLSHDISLVLEKNTMDLVVDRFKRRLQGEDVPSIYEIEFKHKDGSKRLTEMRVSVGRKVDGSLTIISQIMDITDYKRLQHQLIQSQKMEAIGTLAGGIAHDFNNLLTVIKGYSDICLMQIDENDDSFKELSAIRSASEKAESLTKQILAFSRKQIFQLQIVDINNLLTELESVTRRLVSGTIEIEMIMASDLPAIKADPVQIEQVLINLIVNARDALNNVTDEGSPKLITIETGEVILDNSFLGNRTGKHVVISVSDTGSGMTKEIQDKIYDPFYTTKETGKGTGLGLATVYGILQQNDASIQVFSEPGKGTIFKIYWPVVKIDTGFQTL